MAEARGFLACRHVIKNSFKELFMRLWLVNPKFMCNKHLCGEHCECHMFVGTIKAKKKIDGYLDNNLLSVEKLRSRHDELAKEFFERGFDHKSPLPDFWYNGRDVEINVNEAFKELMSRCPSCYQRMKPVLN